MIYNLRRAVESLSNETILEDSLDTDVYNETGEFDARVFWSINVGLIVFFIAICVYCYYADTSWLTNIEQRRRQTDAEYQASLRDREERRKQAKIMAPEKRRRLLLASFRRHNVAMVCYMKYIMSCVPCFFAVSFHCRTKMHVCNRCHS